MNELKLIMQSYLSECEIHKSKIDSAKDSLKPLFPLDIQIYSTKESELSSTIDQMVYRFSKLQDTLGEKVFPIYLQLGGEDPKKKTFIDLLNRLEELEVVSKSEWLYLREVRNEIAHEYNLNQEKLVKILNQIYSDSGRLIQIYDSISAKIHGILL